jgi:ABC-type phosphate transport system substrate-binding protein
MKRTTSTLLLAFVLLTAPAALAAGPRLVVHASNSIPSITKSKAADLFLKRVTRWDNGRAVVPVDLSEKTPARAMFCKALLGKEVVWVKSYWQKMIFSGRATPPAELSSEAELLDFIRNNADAIGYVGESATLPAGVKVLPVVE